MDGLSRHVNSGLRRNDGVGRAGNDGAGTALWIPAYAGMTVRDTRVMTGPAQPCPSGLRIKSAMTV